MNLTSKRLLAIAAAATGLFALSASAKDYAYDTFETDQTWDSYPYWNDSSEIVTGLHATNNMSILDFKKVLGEGSTYDCCWTSSVPGSEASTITNAPIDWTQNRAGLKKAVPGTNGTVGATTSQYYLNLSTEGGQLSRVFGGTLNHQAKVINATAVALYVDTMIQFTASEDAPSDLSSDVQLALWINKTQNDNMGWGASNLMIYCKGYLDDQTIMTTNYSIAANIDPAKWYRLTIKTAQINAVNVFSIYLDGDLITNRFAWSEIGLGGTTGTDKCWFMGLNVSGEQNLNQLAFTGTGAIDDLVISETLPEFGSSSAIALVLSWGSDIASITQDSIVQHSGFTVETGKPISITAADWYCFTQAGILGQIPAGVTYDSASVVVSPADGTQYTNVQVTITGITTSTNLTLTAEKYSTGTITIGGNTVDAAKSATWATANNVSESSFNSFYKQYLLNMSNPTETTEAAITLAITEITYGATESTIKVQAKNGSTQVPLNTAINGTLAYQASDTLAGLSSATIVKQTLSSDKFVEGQAIVTVPATAGKFIKAWIE